MRFTSRMKPMSSMRSASSSTSVFTVERSSVRCCTWSSRRPGWRRDVERAREAIDLRLHADAAEDHGRLHRRVLAVDAHGFLDLRGELARGRQDQHADPPARLGVAAATWSVSRCRMGSTKPAVLPVPVWAPASRSRRRATAGMRFSDGVGRYSVFGDGAHDQVTETQ